jgi:ribosomal 50S subunit-recycling heat shock protein
MEEILKQARELYPAGTKYICAADNPKTGRTRTVENPKSFTINENKIYGDPGEGCIYYKGEWAEIVGRPSYLLKRGDIVKFKVRDQSFRYKVLHNHLENTDETGANHEIFQALGMDSEDKMRFCDDIYGYEAEYGGFPECKDEDFEALTEVVKALYDECNKANYLVSSEDW